MEKGSSRKESKHGGGGTQCEVDGHLKREATSIRHESQSHSRLAAGIVCLGAFEMITFFLADVGGGGRLCLGEARASAKGRARGVRGEKGRGGFAKAASSQLDVTAVYLWRLFFFAWAGTRQENALKDRLQWQERGALGGETQPWPVRRCLVLSTRDTACDPYRQLGSAAVKKAK